MKKTAFLTFLFILFSAFTAGAEEYVRIGLKYNTNVITSCIVSSYEEGTLSVYANETNILDNTTDIVKVSYIDGLVAVSDIGDTQTYCMLDDPGSFIEISSSNQIVEIDGKAYRGTLIFTIASGGIQVVNYVEVEEYLKSVVPSEMPSGWNIEALKAQAVCARNYTLMNKGKFSKYGFDLDDTTACQVYKGLASEKPQSTEAVEATRGVVINYDGKVASLFYSSSSGGYTEDVKNVWGSSGYPYLINVYDPYDAMTKWEVKYTLNDLKTKLLASGIDIGDITNVEVLKRTDGGRALELVVTGTQGTHTANRDKTRNIFAFKSSLYGITIGGSSESREYNVLTANGQEIRTVSADILTSKGINFAPSLNVMPGEVAFKGYGYGHGIGMSQYGAKGFAERGYTYDMILLHYFPGTNLSTY